MNAWQSVQSYCSRYPLVTAGLLYSLVLIVLFREFIFSDKMLMSHDVIESAIPYLKYFKDYFLANSSVPLWDPYRFCGLPFIDAIHGHAGALYPFTFISLIGSIPRAIGFNMVLHYLAACVFAYLAAREIGLKSLPATFVGLAYGLSPTLVSWVYPGHDGKLFVAAWLPLAVYLTERLRKSPSLPLVAGLGLVIAAAILTPHLQAVLYVLILLLVYSFAQIAFDLYETKEVGRNIRFVGWMAVAGAIGLGVSSVQWIPAYRHISEFSPRAQSERGPAWADTFSLNCEELVSIVLPEFAGVNIIGEKYSYWGKNDFKDNSEAVGILPCLLALLALLVPGFRRQKIIWASIAGLVILYSLGNSTPFFRFLLAVIPPLDRMRAPSTSMFVAAFAIATLAGIAIQNICELIAQKEMERLRRARYVLIGGAALFAVLLLASLTMGEKLVAMIVGLWHSSILPSVSGTPEKWQLALNNLPSLRIGLFVGAVVSVGATIALFFRPLGKGRGVRISALIALLIIGSYQFDQRFIHTIFPARPFGETAVSRYLQTCQDKDRTVGFPVPTRWYQLGYHGIYSPAGVNDKALRWSVDFLGGRAHSQLLNPRIVNLTGTRYIVAPATQQMSQFAYGERPLQLAMRHDQTVVHRNDNSFPRAYFAGNVLVIADVGAIYDSVQGGTEDLRATVYLEKPVSVPPVVSDSVALPTPRIVSYSPDSVVISANTTVDRVLVLTDTYHPNWQVYVDGNKSELLRAYGTFRAVVVPAGSSTVVFRYEDNLHNTTLIISMMSLLVCAVLFGAGWYKRRRSG